MKKQRTIKELLKVMLDNQKLFKNGLCTWNKMLYKNNIITFDEYFEVETFIRQNRPSAFSSIDAFKHSKDAFYWECGNITPRIKWINKHINKLTK